MKYVLYADRFGWTPPQVEALSAVDDLWFLPIHDMLLEVRRDNAKQHSGSR